MTHRFTLLSLLTLLLPIASFAQLSPEALAQRFQQLDANNDQILTEDEVPKRLFNRLDSDKDGKVALEEAQKALASSAVNRGPLQAMPLLEAYFSKADSNGDGSLSREETSDAAWFDRLDLNRDQLVSITEAQGLVGELLNPGRQPATTTEPVEPAQSVAQGPEILKPGDVGIGRQVPDIVFTDLDGKQRRLSDFGKSPALVIAYTSATCPVSKRFAGDLAKLEKSLKEQGVPMVLVNPFGSESQEKIDSQIAEKGFQSPYVRDTDLKLSQALQARTTTEVFLLDSTRTLIYRGALSDQYGISYNLEEPRVQYLQEALAALEEGRRPRIAATGAPGCELDIHPVDPAPASGLTYHRDIERILQQNCVQCHHDGGIAPFALDDFAEVADRARTIKRVVEDGTMPPWFAEEEEGSRLWENDRSLSARDKSELLAWLQEADREKGDPADAPEPLVFNSDGWELGEPDHILVSQKHQVKADGVMPYVYSNVPTGLTGEKWLQAIEVQPSDREVVHHILIFLRDPSNSKQRFDELNGYFAVYVPGTSTMIYPEGVAKRVPAGSELRFQMHYTPNGKAVEEQTRVGFYFADEAPAYEAQVASVANPKIHIPAGAPNHAEYGHRLIRDDITVLGFLPHLHTRGKAFKYELVYPDGNETLLNIPRYDFNWQLYYRLKEPLHLPVGTTMKVTAWYDNSTSNPANPDPTKDVRWGQQTFDEMLIGYVEYIVPVSAGQTETASLSGE